MTEKTVIRHKSIKTVLLLALCIASVLFSKFTVNLPVQTNAQRLLDEKKEVLTELTTLTAMTSTGIAAVPDDSTTPIANQIAGMSSPLLILMSVIMFEQFLIGITGQLSFLILLPLACIAAIIWLHTHKHFFRKMALQLLMLGISFYIAIPICTQASLLVDKSLKLEETIDVIREETKDPHVDDVKEETKNVLGTIVDTVRNADTIITSTINDTVDYLKQILNHFIVAIAALLVSCLIIPIFIILILRWSNKKLIGAYTKSFR